LHQEQLISYARNEDGEARAVEKSRVKLA